VSVARSGFLLAWVWPVVTFAQTQMQRDSVVDEICKTIQLLADQPDTVRIYTAYEEHLYPFVARYPEEIQDEISENIYFRLQRNCWAFKEILIRAEPPNPDWDIVSEKPVTRLKKKTCRQFLQHGEYTYLESTGDTVRLRLEPGYWTDHFIDGTYSRLKFRWTGDCSFEIEFIESNNVVRRNFSQPGDVYRYQVVDKKEGYYEMSVEIPGSDLVSMFKLHY
jgi:hypothetical protein